MFDREGNDWPLSKCCFECFDIPPLRETQPAKGLDYEYFDVDPTQNLLVVKEFIDHEGGDWPLSKCSFRCLDLSPLWEKQPVKGLNDTLQGIPEIGYFDVDPTQVLLLVKEFVDHTKK